MTAPGARDALLAKAVAYFAGHGIRDTSLRTLAGATGTSQRMLHYHFGGRAELLAAVVESVAAAEVAALDRLVADGVDPFEALGRHWDSVRDAARTFGPVFFELCTHAMHGQPYAATLPDVLVTRYAAAFARIYSTMTDPLHAERLARLSLGVGRGVLFDMLLDHGNPDATAAADAAVEEFTRMVRDRLDVTTS